MLPLLRCLFWINFDGVFFFKVLISLVSTFGYSQKKNSSKSGGFILPPGCKKGQKDSFFVMH